MSVRSSLAALQLAPRYLSRDQAAAYVGVSPDLFDQEVRAGLWPPPRRRGTTGRRLTWDRLLLDAAADREAGLAHNPAPSPEPLIAREDVERAWREQTYAPPPKRARQARQKAAR